MSFQRRTQREHFTAELMFPKPAPRVKEKPEPKKRSRIAWRSPKRIERESVFKPYQAWLHGAGALCVVCGTSINIQGSHVGIGGAGLKHGSTADQIRMCGTRGRQIGCHAQWEQYKGFFEGWTTDRRQIWSAAQRIVSWEAFRDWAGGEIAKAVTAGVPNAEIEPLIACDEAIGTQIAALALTGAA